LKNKDGLVTATELESGLNKLNLFQQPLAEEEISGILKQQSTNLQKGLDFEGFLQVIPHCTNT
jgi:Ca2+-binding EF-hand superfamily protein